MGIEAARARATTTSKGRGRAVTVAPRAAKAERDELAADEDYPDVERPHTREDCASMPRPCPFVSCSMHLFLDVNPESGAIKLNFPYLEVDQLDETCALDVADRGGATLEEVGRLINVTRERTRQIETRGLYQIRARRPDLAEPTEDRVTTGDALAAFG